jgi:hypothetical protein
MQCSYFHASYCVTCSIDIGLLCGAAMCGRRRDEWWKLKVLIPLYVSFFLGGMIGARMALELDALWFPAATFGTHLTAHFFTFG